MVDLCDSELDHRLALQFGGGNEEGNLWTLCTECHQQKSAREVSTGQPDAEALSHPVAQDSLVTDLLLPEPGGGSVPGKKPIPPDTAPPLMQRKKSCSETINVIPFRTAFWGKVIYIQYVELKKCLYPFYGKCLQGSSKHFPSHSFSPGGLLIFSVFFRRERC
nr:HNH endonuclease [Escherichia coli]